MFKMDDAAFSRIGTHDIEIFFRRIRLLFFFNYTFDNALRGTINSIFFNRNSNEIGYKYKIRDRINESGILENISNVLIIFLKSFFIEKGFEYPDLKPGIKKLYKIRLPKSYENIWIDLKLSVMIEKIVMSSLL